MRPLQTLGKYELLEKLGSGGMAEVFKARQTGVEGFEKLVVVKKILPGYARNLSFIKMLIEEAKLTSVLQHPNIVQIFELDSVEKQYYMAMEYVDGKDLLKVLARCAETKRIFPPHIACYFAAEVCKGLHYAHHARDIYGRPLNIIHRDVSPSNVIASWTGHVKIMDFGVAKARTQDTKGSKHVLRGKLGYMSPEQVKGEEVDHRADLFSLGIVLFESLTLKRLFLGRTDLETLINIRDADVEKKFKKYPHVDDGLKEILRKALAAEREDRFSTAMEFNEALNDYLFQLGQRIDYTSIAAFQKDLFGDEAETQMVVGSDGASRAEEGGKVTSSALVSRPPTAPSVPQMEQLEEVVELEEVEVGESTADALPKTVEERESIQEKKETSASKKPRAEKATRPVGKSTKKKKKEPKKAEPEKAEPEPAKPEKAEPEPAKPEKAPPEKVKPLPKEAEKPDPPVEPEESSPEYGVEGSAEDQSRPDLEGHEFRLRNTSGYVFGPVAYENLVNLVQTGAVSEEEFVSIDGGDWKQVREIAAVRTLSPNEALRNKGITPIYSGSLSRTGLVRVFYQIVSRQLTGKLRLTKGSAQKEFFFRKGKPKHVSSNLKQELLGPFLLKRGVVKEEQMNTAIEKSGEFGGRLGDALVSLGFVKPHELYWLLDQQFKEKFIQVFAMTEGGYEFYEGVPAPIEMAPSDANVYRYVLEGVRKHASRADIEPFFRQFVTSPIRERANRYLKQEELPLNSQEQRLVGQLTVGPQGYGKILKDHCRNDADREAVFHLLLVLYQLELIMFQTG